MRVWVDLTNSPHALFFAPLVRRLRERGDDVLVTVRRFAHTVELAERLFDDPHIVGRGQRSALVGKVGALGSRVQQLLPIVRAWGPDVAIGHGSYDQPVTARLLRVPSLTMVDYEYHPATHLLFRLARRLLLPAAFPAALVNSHGGRGKTWRYHGLKEEVYLADFRPDESILTTVGLGGFTGRIVTLRPPAVGALYHRNQNPLWSAMVDHLQRLPDVHTLVLPRHPAQVEALREHCAAETMTVLDRPIDGPQLIWASDAVISAGGTMNREAVVLGVPVWTMFAGRMGSVDRSLIGDGRMKRIVDTRDVDGLVVPRRHRGAVGPRDHRMSDQVIRALDRTAALGPRHPGSTW